METVITAEWIKEERAKRGWSQGDLAEKLEVHYTMVSKWERGVSPTPEQRLNQMEDIFKDVFEASKVNTSPKEVHNVVPDVKVENNQIITTSRNVAEVFEKEHRNVVRDILQLIKDTLKTEHISNMFQKTSYKDSMNRTQTKYLINRDGFTLLAMGYTGKKALQFKLDYIKQFNEMEQQLLSPKASYEITDPVKRAEAWIKEQQEKEELLSLTHQQEQIIGELQPSADYTDTILQSPDLITITQVAKDYGMSGQAFNEYLNEIGIQYKQNGQWLLYSKHQGKGYTSSQTYRYAVGNGFGSSMYTKWTQKGRLFLYEILKANDVIPLIEQEGVD